MSDNHQEYAHWATPKRVRVQSLVEHHDAGRGLKPRNVPGGKREIFRQLGIPEATAYRIIKSRRERRHLREETRGRKSIITQSDIRYLEYIIQSNGQDGRTLSWAALAHEACINASERTIRRTLRTLDYRRCIACKKSWIKPQLAAQRVKFAREMLTKYPRPDDWKNVRFSDETHLGFGPQSRIHVLRKPGERECPDCVQTAKQPREEDEKKVHCWGVVGYGYKSKLYRYDTHNSNGKMTQKVYLSLLQQEVASWPSHWVLEEDGDSGHGGKGVNIVKAWKERHQLKHYFNCVASPDLAPIENAWVAPKEHLRQTAHWTEEVIWELTLQGWEALSQETIDNWCLSMPKRLQDVIDLQGQMTAY